MKREEKVKRKGGWGKCSDFKNLISK